MKWKLIILLILQMSGEEKTGANLAGRAGRVKEVCTPALFRNTLNFVIKFLNQYRRNALKNQF